ncbi:Uncharacterised protein [Salmonella enterica subsp. enterica serovar Typhimurium str. DT104]|nr:Uncharacterised protein [Salmonella enterica subsp. enterica serovar Typhimurium str. DT104]
MVQIIGRSRTVNSVTVERLIEITIGIVVVNETAIVYIVTINSACGIHIIPIKRGGRIVVISPGIVSSSIRLRSDCQSASQC